MTIAEGIASGMPRPSCVHRRHHHAGGPMMEASDEVCSVSSCYAPGQLDVSAAGQAYPASSRTKVLHILHRQPWSDAMATQLYAGPSSAFRCDLAASLCRSTSIWSPSGNSDSTHRDLEEVRMSSATQHHGMSSCTTCWRKGSTFSRRPTATPSHTLLRAQMAACSHPLSPAHQAKSRSGTQRSCDASPK